MRELVLRDVNIDISPNHRHSVTKNFHLSDVLCTRLKSDPTLRLMLFSAIEQPLAAYTRAEITFPSQIEVRVNNDEVRANFKGLKNKPGSTRPADITDLVRLAPAMYKNNLHITYALTQKESQKVSFFPLLLCRLGLLY
jgi:E3 SUMO-protein ligase PIAS1